MTQEQQDFLNQVAAPEYDIRNQFTSDVEAENLAQIDAWLAMWDSIPEAERPDGGGIGCRLGCDVAYALCRKNCSSGVGCAAYCSSLYENCLSDCNLK